MIKDKLELLACVFLVFYFGYYAHENFTKHNYPRAVFALFLMVIAAASAYTQTVKYREKFIKES